MARLRFDPQALYDAVDAEGQKRGLSWGQLSEHVHVSTSTIKGMPSRTGAIELDGVLGLTRWVGRTVESFSGGDGGAAPHSGDYVSTGRFLRFDTAGCHDALDQERAKRGLSWDEAAREILPGGALSAAQLKSMAKGGRASVHVALAVCQWLGKHIDDFTKLTLR